MTRRAKRGFVGQVVAEINGNRVPERRCAQQSAHDGALSGDASRYHFDAVRAIVPAAFVDSASFYPGSFPIDYGDATAGLVSLSTRSDLAKSASALCSA